MKQPQRPKTVQHGTSPMSARYVIPPKSPKPKKK